MLGESLSQNVIQVSLGYKMRPYLLKFKKYNDENKETLSFLSTFHLRGHQGPHGFPIANISPGPTTYLQSH